MRYNLIIAVIIAPLCMLSCKKEKKTQVQAPPIDSVISAIYPNYMPLRPGSYWIYQQYVLDSVNGAAIPSTSSDSCYVEKDTIINNHTYHKYCSPQYLSGSPIVYDIAYLRDSLSYTVNSSGIIVFSSQDFSTVSSTVLHTNPMAGIVDTISITYQMVFKDSIMNVPLGSFKTCTFRKIYHLPAPTYKYGPLRDYDYSYAEGVGLVKVTLGFYISSPQITERRLLRYHLQ